MLKAKAGLAAAVEAAVLLVLGTAMEVVSVVAAAEAAGGSGSGAGGT